MSEKGFSLFELLIGLLLSITALGVSLLHALPSTGIEAKRIESFIRWSQNQSLIRGEKVILRKQHKAFSAKGITWKRLMTLPLEFHFQGSNISFYVSGAASPKTIRVEGSPPCRVILSLRGRIRRTCST